MDGIKQNIFESLNCINSSVSSENDKKVALNYLEGVQKEHVSWRIMLEMLNTSKGDKKENTSDSSMLIFAAQTLRNKITYDLNQLEPNEMEEIKYALLNLVSHSTFNKVVMIQLYVSLAKFAIQYVTWKKPVQEIITNLLNEPDRLLEFLKILPEETLDMKGITLTEDEFTSRIHELISAISINVLQFLIDCSSNGVSPKLVLSCLSTWSGEFPIEQLITVEPLMNLIFQTLYNNYESDNDSFEGAITCLIFILRETRDIPNQDMIMSLYNNLIQLNNALLSVPANRVDPDILDAMTRVFVEAGEAWCVFIAKTPNVFRPLVEVLLFLTCSSDQDLDIVKYVFPFWFDLKQFLVLPRYSSQKKEYMDIYQKLLTGIIEHLKYPEDKFDSKEEEDKFKDFRYDMGDVLKDCTAVVGPLVALTQPLEILKHFKHWQSVEAALFALRTMAHEVPRSENQVLPQIIPFLCSDENNTQLLPDHQKVKYSIILVLGRYTEWTNNHPKFLGMQLSYIYRTFDSCANDPDILNASSHALMFFCQDCKELLSPHINDLMDLYYKVSPLIDVESNFEICQGLSSVINQLPVEQLTENLAIFLSKFLPPFNEMCNANEITSDLSNKIADQMDLLYGIFSEIYPRSEATDTKTTDPVVVIVQQLWEGSLKSIFTKFINNSVVMERGMKLTRQLFSNLNCFMEPLLPSIVEFIAHGFSTTGLSCYLWCSGSIIAIFGDTDSYPTISPQVKSAVWEFACQQCITFMNNFNKIPLDIQNDGNADSDKIILQYSDMIYDFFLMVSDALMFYPEEFINSYGLMDQIVEIILKTCTVLNDSETCGLVIRCLDDIILWGFNTPPISSLTIKTTPPQWKEKVLTTFINKGPQLVNILINGLIFKFSKDESIEVTNCLSDFIKLIHSSGNEKYYSLLLEWFSKLMDRLKYPVDPQQKAIFLDNISKSIKYADFRKLKSSIYDFTNWYRRKWVSSRLYNN
ncbi:mRNA transport regulator MTR10 SCDLUD_003280 [Saccharomycodes ludwigii]|uniref:mRNA transport regulator MTR10 n=1 Tax=Saccharomycodes ludwigii TaxID=36035 RepID=UPI001E820EF5|nr:hypothetical protein SCDLUD_003280 [Saccharomycodes ludwigii]KAH3900308.1 hypothetical protein SCDLUD_003280 [Saccharomycodes ludwigii]